MVNRSAEFASLLCSRLCHDLLSPVGALSNGIELLADETDADMRAQVMQLLADSAASAANKLKFFRLAFGAAGGFSEMVDAREARAAIEGLHGAEGKVRIGWMVEAPALPKISIKILLNLALIAGDALVRGGQLDIAAEGGEVVLRAEGPRIILDPDIRNALVGEVDPDLLMPRAAAAWLVHLLVSEQGGKVQVSSPGEGVLIFGASLPA